MYAIVDIAGHQFKVETGMEIFVNRLAAEKGAAVEFDKVLLVDADGAVKGGAPYVEGAVVKATVLDDTCRGKKVLVFKKKRRKGYQKLTGHRQDLTKLQINEIAKLTFRGGIELWHIKKASVVPRTVVNHIANDWALRSSEVRL